MVAPRRWLAALLLVTASCATSSASADTSPRAAKNPNFISHEELADPVVVSMDALKAIRHLRPLFFRTSGPNFSTSASIGFSYDYGPVQPISLLSSFSTLLLYEVQYLDANGAAAQFGLNANGMPVIVLMSGKQSR